MEEEGRRAVQRAAAVWPLPSCRATTCMAEVAVGTQIAGVGGLCMSLINSDVCLEHGIEIVPCNQHC